MNLCGRKRFPGSPEQPDVQTERLCDRQMQPRTTFLFDFEDNGDFDVENNDRPTCRVTILSKNAKYLETKVESQYGTEYHVDRISESLISQWQVVIIVVSILIVKIILIFNDKLLPLHSNGSVTHSRPEPLMLQILHINSAVLTQYITSP